MPFWRGGRRVSVGIRCCRSVLDSHGTGKSWLGLRVAQVLRVPFVELDAIHHLSGWEPIDPEEFLTRVATVAATDA